MWARGDRTLRSPLWLGSPSHIGPPWLGLLLGGGTSQCLSIPVNAASMRLTAYGWRKPQLLQKRGRYGRASPKLGSCLHLILRQMSVCQMNGADRNLRKSNRIAIMPSTRCKQCNEPLVEIDHWGERLTGCPKCNRWQASTGEWCRLAPGRHRGATCARSHKD
jgi:hypothetical protein